MNKCRVCEKELPDGVLCCQECRTNPCKKCSDANYILVCETDSKLDCPKFVNFTKAQRIISEAKKKKEKEDRDLKVERNAISTYCKQKDKNDFKLRRCKRS